MKPTTKIRIELELPESWSNLKTFPKSAAFRNHLAKAAEIDLQARCDDHWLREQHVRYLQKEEQERRRRFAQTIASLKGRGTKEASSQETGHEIGHSKKAPVATSSNPTDSDE